MTAFTGLWYLAVKRKAIEGRSLFLVVFGVIAGQGVYTIARPATAPAAYLYGLLLVSLALIVFIPIMFRVGGVFAAERLELLPLSHVRLFLVRMLFDNPVRPILAASTFVWGCVGIFLLPVPFWTRAAAVVVLALLVVCALAGAQAFENALSQRLPVTLYVLSVIFGLSGLQLLFFYADAYEDLGIPLFRWSAAVLPTILPLEGWTSLLWWMPLVIGIVLVLRRLSRSGGGLQNAATRLGSFAGRGRYSLPLRSGQVIWRSHRAKVAREIALALRLTFYRAFAAVSLALAGVAVATHEPLLLLAAFFPFLVFLHNSIGADMPGGGLDRLRLLPIQLRRLLVYRHAAAGVIGFAITSAALMIGWLLGTPLPLLESISAQSLGVATIAISAVSGDQASIHRPKAVALDTVLLDGGFVRGLGWLGVAVTCALAIAVPLSIGALLLGANLVSDLPLLLLAAMWLSTIIFGTTYVAQQTFFRRG